MRTAESVSPKVLRNRIAQAKWSKNNREARREIGKRYNQTPKGIYAHLKKRCFITNTALLPQMDFLTWHQEQQKNCTYCHIPEPFIAKLSDRKMSGCKRLTIDRKDPKQGYIESNMVLACPTCNFLKSNLFTFDEMIEIGKVIKKKWSKQI